MDNKKIAPTTRVRGTVEVPGDKSISHRAVILGALSNRVCTVENFLTGEDCLSTVQIFRDLGIQIDQSGTTLQIHGKGLEGLKAPSKSLDCGNSGTTARLMMGVLTGHPFECELVGDASLSRRPMGRVMKPLSQMGANFRAVGKNPEQLPLKIAGTRSVRTIRWESPVASAQVKSAILLAGLYASGTTEVVEPQRSRDHTERMLRASSVIVEEKGQTVSVQGTATLRASQFKVPSDLSSAAFMLAAGLLLADKEIVVRHVGVNPTRTGFLDAVKAMGGVLKLDQATEWCGEPVADVRALKSNLKATTIDSEMVTRAIDEIPILATLATQAKGKTIIRDAKELRVKESDRLSTFREEFSKMGAQITELPDGLEIEGPTRLKGAIVKSHGDHRLAMCLAIAALTAEGPTTIEDVGCVATSFPTFWSLLEQIRG